MQLWWIFLQLMDVFNRIRIFLLNNTTELINQAAFKTIDPVTIRLRLASKYTLHVLVHVKCDKIGIAIRMIQQKTRVKLHRQCCIKTVSLFKDLGTQIKDFEQV